MTSASLTFNEVSFLQYFSFSDWEVECRVQGSVVAGLFDFVNLGSQNFSEHFEHDARPRANFRNQRCFSTPFISSDFIIIFSNLPYYQRQESCLFIQSI